MFFPEGYPRLAILVERVHGGVLRHQATSWNHNSAQIQRRRTQ